MNNDAIKNSGIIIFLTLALNLTASAQPGGGGGRQGPPPSAEQIFEMMDANKDKRLSKDEVRGPLVDEFSTIDTNKDGYLTEEELKNGPGPQKQGQSGGRR